jgi:hypothetical protein
LAGMGTAGAISSVAVPPPRARYKMM